MILMNKVNKTIIPIIQIYFRDHCLDKLPLIFLVAKIPPIIKKKSLSKEKQVSFCLFFFFLILFFLIKNFTTFSRYF